MADVVLILGSGPNVVEARSWLRHSFDRVVAINNAWQVREDWDDLIFPEDFPLNRRPQVVVGQRRLVEAKHFVPAQNAYGGFVYGGGTMAFTAGYWALHALKPRVMAFMGCDMVYPANGPTHYYGKGTADPLRDDVTLQDLGAKSARLSVIAARQGCACVNLSVDASELIFPRAVLSDLRQMEPDTPAAPQMEAALAEEARLGYFVESGRYWEATTPFDPVALRNVDSLWRKAYEEKVTPAVGVCAA